MEIQAVDAKNEVLVLEFLERYEDTSQFLMNNLTNYGSTIGEAPHSGNFKVIVENNKVFGVFCLTKKGILLQQSIEDFSDLVYESCMAEAQPIKGIVGDWSCQEAMFNKVCEMQPEFNPSFNSVEVLFSYKLSPEDPRLEFNANSSRLSMEDYDDFLPLRLGYLKELNLPDQLSADEKRYLFESGVSNQTWWGMKIDEELVSIAGLNSSSASIGQVGGVYTKPSHRRKGYSRSLMFHMLKDCLELHGHNKSILFTGEEDRHAYKLYESMGYDRVGKFALILSE